MTKNDLQKQLDDLGVDYDKRWGVPKLEEALKEHSENTNTVSDSIVNVTKDELEELTDGCQNKNEKDITPEAKETIKEIRKNAIEAHNMLTNRLHQREVSDHIQRFGEKNYVKVEKHEYVEIYETNSGAFIRAYTLKDHGENYKELADRFIEGRRRKGL